MRDSFVSLEYFSMNIDLNLMYFNRQVDFIFISIHFFSSFFGGGGILQNWYTKISKIAEFRI